MKKKEIDMDKIHQIDDELADCYVTLSQRLEEIAQQYSGRSIIEDDEGVQIIECDSNLSNNKNLIFPPMSL